LHIPKQFW